MASQRGSASVVSILLVLGILGAGVAVAALWPLVSAAGRNQAAMRPATATVVEPSACGAPSARDLVEVQIDGVVRQAPFDGCGHARGQQIQVQVPARSGGDFVVQPKASDDKSPEALESRANWVLLTLAAVAGGGYGVLLASRPRGSAEAATG